MLYPAELRAQFRSESIQALVKPQSASVAAGFELVVNDASGYDRSMSKIIVRSLFLLFALGAPLAYATAPAINICVSDGAGKVAFKGVASVNAPFVTNNLAAGNYVVQFNASDSTLRGHQYLLVVSAGRTKVSASSVAAEKFGQGGVAMRVTVAPGDKITGQVAREPALVSDIALERVQAWQDRAGEGSLRNHYAGRTFRMVGQTGRGY
jgi:hypothetical protein